MIKILNRILRKIIKVFMLADAVEFLKKIVRCGEQSNQLKCFIDKR